MQQNQPFHQQTPPTSTLTKPKIYNLLKLQQLFYNKFLTVQLLHQLVSLYTCCIQSIDQKQSDLRIYFLEKIQFVLSRNQVQALLNSISSSTSNKNTNMNGNGNNTGKNMDNTADINNKNSQQQKYIQSLRQTYRQTYRQTSHSQLQLQPQNMQTPNIPPNFDKRKLYNYDGDNPDEKRKKIDIQIQLMKQMQSNMKNITNQVQAINQKHQNQNLRIKNIAKQQNNRLEERLLARKRKRVRKQSVDFGLGENNKDKDQDEGGNGNGNGGNNKINKNQFIKAQNQINQAIVRITIRATQRKNKQQEGPKQGYVKGKVKKSKNDNFID